MNAAGAGTDSLTKKSYSICATRRAVSGCIDSALIRSRPSCMPETADRDGIVVPPSLYTGKLNVLAAGSCWLAL